MARLQGYRGVGEGGSGKKKGGGNGSIKAIKEVVVFRNPRVVHVYNVVEHGRLHYRSNNPNNPNTLHPPDDNPNIPPDDNPNTPP